MIKNLTDAQSEAVNFDSGDPSNLLILACAGSGKTETLACRAAQMVQDGVPRGSIVAFTFTEHAAAELKHRIRRRVEEANPDEPALGDMYVGTIHAYCLRVLRKRVPGRRIFEVMDETRQAALIAANFVRFPGGDGIGLDRLRTRTRSGTYGETLNTFLATLNVIHQQEIDIDNIGDPVLASAVDRYREIAHGDPNYFFDFNNIIDTTIDLLRSDSDVLKEIRAELRHLFVDEYQDVDDRQEELIRLLTDGGHNPTLTVVGDDDQALYGFRGAKVDNILDFEREYPNVRVVRLEDNFRSTHAIVSIADEAVRRVSRRIRKEPKARLRAEPDGPLEERFAEPGDILLETFPSEEAEARWVAERIEAVRGTRFVENDGTERGLDYGDMAILLRSVRGAGAHFAEALRARGIPVVVTGTGGLFHNEEVRLVQAAFSLLARADFALPNESGGGIRLLSTAETREFVRGAVSALRDSGRLGESANSTHLLSWLDQKRAELDQRAVARTERSRGLGARIYPQEIFQQMLRELGAKEDPWPESTMFNLGAFSNLLTQFERVHQWITPARLKSLVLFLSNWATRHVDEGGVSEPAALNSVKIMTVHAAKGLEWPVVFLPRISSRVFPSSLRTRPPETFLPPGSYDTGPYVGGDDGERRLWYVALTRCAKFLHISSLDRHRTRPTPYFREIVHPCAFPPGSEPPEHAHIEPTPPADSNLLQTTYSDLAAFRRCEREYQLRALMDFSPGVGEQFGYGQRIHDILAEVHNRAIGGETITADVIRDLVARRFRLRYTRGKPFYILRDAAERALVRYVARAGDALSRARAAEKPFELVDRESDALIAGVVDLLERPEEADESAPPSQREIIGLVDFKASRIGTVEEYEATVEAAREQLQLYAVGVGYAFGMESAKATARILSPKPLPDEVTASGRDEWIKVAVDREAQEAAEAKLFDTVSQLRERLQNRDFPTSGASGGKCGRCDFQTFCPGYDEFVAEGGSAATNTPAEEVERETDLLAEDADARSTP
ncbi:ATP-dependent DNA helicase [Candidatus Palauibacter soopunensis]|uniref:ATP-dependent DNA helicase n=1 Tax=Candidatus Palauibacter soopunensis TaxID=3056739 RepID=UPI0023829F2A|nr:ATP-dependent DNA helicase [Candidatus Palauibacter soopunensis]MDE2877865.1 ATP-dependent DNA helicase [Candidatus Palauibacter soopunensis]